VTHGADIGHCTDRLSHSRAISRATRVSQTRWRRPCEHHDEDDDDAATRTGAPLSLSLFFSVRLSFSSVACLLVPPPLDFPHSHEKTTRQHCAILPLSRAMPLRLSSPRHCSAHYFRTRPVAISVNAVPASRSVLPTLQQRSLMVMSHRYMRR